jgi:hypothetical protein
MRPRKIVVVALGLCVSVGVVLLVKESQRSGPFRSFDLEEESGKKESAQAGRASLDIRAPVPHLLASPRVNDANRERLMRASRIADQFVSESRDPVWAPRMEGIARRAAEEDLAKFIKSGTVSVEVECRTSICRVEAILDKKKSDDAEAEGPAVYRALQQTQYGSICLNKGMAKNNEDFRVFRTICSIPPEDRDDYASEPYFEARRAARKAEMESWFATSKNRK